MGPDVVAIARVLKPRGLRGEMVATVLTDFPDRFHDLESVIGLLPDGRRIDLTIENFWFHQKGRIVFKFSGYESVEDAERLRSAEICVAASDAVELETDEYFDWELVGCRVTTPDGLVIGTVTEVMRTGGTELLAVEGSGKDYLIPFASTICTAVDVENKLITIDPPEGLLEF